MLLAALVVSALVLMVMQELGPISKFRFARKGSQKDDWAENGNGDVAVVKPATRPKPEPKTEPKQVPENHRWPFGYKPVLKPKECQDDGCDFAEAVVICVSAASEYVERRQAIRQTWGSDPANRVLFFFGLNTSNPEGLNEEAEKYNDIVQYDFEDSYKNLTLKSVAMLRFVDENRWPKLRYFIKADDDTFINTRNLPQTLGAISNDKDRGIYGSLQVGSRPMRNRKDKWFVSRKEFSEKVFPAYLSGCFYVIPLNLLKILSAKATSVPFMYLEDAYITGIVARLAKIPRLRVGKHIVDHGYGTPTAHLIAKKYVAKHYMTPARMFEAFKAVEELPR